ncbi:potassium channel protein [Phormidium tenue FACHB-886]|nr:potassium channel protein [Phormidium tenue FACHB-886]
MTQTNLSELAKNGDRLAIATLLNRTLADPETQIKVDWHGGTLNLRFVSSETPDQAGAIAFVQSQLSTLQIDSLQTIRLFGYRANQPAPVWHHLFAPTAAVATTNAETSIQASEEPLAPAGETVEQIDRFIVCGLGDLGQYCVLNLRRFALREFEIHVAAIDRRRQNEWEVHDLPSLLVEPPIVGDCRNDEVLLKAGITHCRAILLVTSDESVNIETAIAARRLNPTVRLVVRSSRQSLNQLLKQQLGNFVAFEPTELPAAAFALAGLREGILGYFDIGDVRLQVVEQRVLPRDRFDGAMAAALHRRSYRLLSYRSAKVAEVPSRAFYQWNTETRIQPGDAVAYVEVVGRSTGRSVTSLTLLPDGSLTSAAETTLIETPWQQFQQTMQDTARRGLRQNLSEFLQWVNALRLRQVIAGGLGFAFALWLLGVSLLLLTVPGIGFGKAASTAAILLLGGYGDVFGGLAEPSLAIPPWVQFVCWLITIASLASVLGILGLITDSLLSSRFDFLRKRPPIPKRNHIVLVGFGRVGQRVAALLGEFRQPVVAITESLDNVTVTSIPVLVGNPVTELAKVNLPMAKSVVVLTEDQLLNLEVALMARETARQIERDIRLVVRTYDQRFRDNLSNLLPEAKALAAYGLSGEAFAGAAFGENILGLFQLNEQTILVTEYAIATDDTLVGKLLSQVAYGYGVVPIFHQRGAMPADLMEGLLPLDDRRLQVGDRLVVLGSINGLRRIEHRDIAPAQRWQLSAQPPLNQDSRQEGRNVLYRLSGCSLEQAQSFVERLPEAIELELYEYQADRLREELSRYLPEVRLTQRSANSKL